MSMPSLSRQVAISMTAHTRLQSSSQRVGTLSNGPLGACAGSPAQIKDVDESNKWQM